MIKLILLIYIPETRFYLIMVFSNLMQLLKFILSIENYSHSFTQIPKLFYEIKQLIIIKFP